MRGHRKLHGPQSDEKKLMLAQEQSRVSGILAATGRRESEASLDAHEEQSRGSSVLAATGGPTNVFAGLQKIVF